MFKRLSNILISILIASCYLGLPAFGSGDIEVQVNGKRISFDVPPSVINGCTMIPARYTTEALGALVNWDSFTNTVIITNKDMLIKLPVNNPIATLNGQEVKLESPAVIIDGRTLVPTRFIAESLGAKVDWNADTRSVIISTSEAVVDITAIPLTIPKAFDERELTASEISKYSESVVKIISTLNDGSTSQGSGFIISGDGRIATNYHVINGARTLEIIFNDNSKLSGDFNVLGYDKEKDIAVLSVPGTKPFSLKIGDPSKSPVGSTIYAIGSPYGLINTFSSGVISAFRDGVIQITAPISHGSSGGALFNGMGEVIGITFSGITEGENLGFAIPITELSKISLSSGIRVSSLTAQTATVQPVQETPNKMSYQQYADYLFSEKNGITVGGDVIKFKQITVDSTLGGSEIVIFCYLDTMNVCKLLEEIAKGKKDEISGKFSDIPTDAQRYYNKSVSAMIVYTFYADFYPGSGLEVNKIFTGTNFKTVNYDISINKWFVWYPYLEVYCDFTTDSYSWQWAL